MRSLRVLTTLIGTVVMLVLGAGAGGGTASAASGAAAMAGTTGIVGCANPMSADTAPPATFRIWVCADGNTHASDQLSEAVAAAQTYYGPMTALMHEPLLDSGGPGGGGSTAIDVYLVNGSSQQ